MDPLRISPAIEIPADELDWQFVRSSGPGGQHVNKTSTQVELRFNILTSTAFSQADRAWLIKKLQSRLDATGTLCITAQESRSQLRNRTLALEKLRELMITSLVRPKPRKKTKPTRSSVEKRLTAKRISSEKKRNRSETKRSQSNRAYD